MATTTTTTRVVSAVAPQSFRVSLTDELVESFIEYLIINGVHVSRPLPERAMRNLEEELLLGSTPNNTKEDRDELLRTGIRRTVARVLDWLQPSDADPGFMFSQSELVVLELICNMYETKEDWKEAENQFSPEYVQYFKQTLWVSQKVLALCDVWESFEGGGSSGGGGSGSGSGSGGSSSSSYYSAKNSGFFRFMLFIADGIGSGQKRNTKTLYTPIGDLIKYAHRKDQDSAKRNNGKSFGLVSAIRSTVMCSMKVLHAILKHNKSGSLSSKPIKKRGIQDVEDTIKMVYDEFRNAQFQPTSLSESVSGPDEGKFAEQLLERLYYILRFVVTFKAGDE